MTLDLLLGQCSETAASIARNRDSVRDLERQYEEIRKSIDAQISQEFGRFVDSINASLPEDQRVTEWHVHYSAELEKAFITITGLNGKPYRSDEFTNRIPLTRYLGDLKRFCQNYPVEVSFEMLNHEYLDIPLAEME